MIINSIILIILLMLNGLLSMSETALISCKKSYIKAKKKHDPQAEVLEDLLTRPGEFVSALQTGITIISVFSGAYSGQQLAEPIGSWLNTYKFIQGYGSIFAFIIVVILMTYISLILSEIVPKKIALTHSEKIALKVAPLIKQLTKKMYFIVKILDISSQTALKIFGHKEHIKEQLNEDEWHELFQQSFEDGVIDAFTRDAFTQILGFSKVQAFHFLKPEEQIACFYLEESIEDQLEKLETLQYHFYPIFKNRQQNNAPLGVLDGQKIFRSAQKVTSISKYIKYVPSVTESTPSIEILKIFQHQHAPLVFVVNDNGSFKGIVTRSDLFKAILGPIQLNISSQETQTE